MKKLITLLAIIATITSFAQAPQGFNYQATVRNSAGALIVNQNVLVKFNIYQNTATGTLVYSENQTATTDDLGHIALVVGQGTATTGTFSTINWGSGSYFLGIELNSGSGYVAMGTTQLLSVPYALYANSSGNAPTATPNLAAVLAVNNGGNNLQIKNIADPTDAKDAVTKQYVDLLQTQINNLQSQLTNNLIAQYPPGSVFCASGPTPIVPVLNPVTGRIWMDRNLGATRVATSSTDSQAFGDLYQWGRRPDGHQCRNSPTTTVISSVEQPNHGEFIISPNSSPWDWLVPQNANLWQGVNGINNPCPTGYRLPTSAEYNTEKATWTSLNYIGAYASNLKLTIAGVRSGSTIIYLNGGAGYWTSTALNGGSTGLNFGNYGNSSTGNPSGAPFELNSRVGGASVRCIKDIPSTAGTIGAINCTAPTNIGTLTQGTAATGVSTRVSYTGGNGGSHSGQTVTSTGVTGLTAILAASTFASGTGSLTYTITGTPIGSGTASFALNIGGQTCTLTVSVANNLAGQYPVGSVFCASGPTPIVEVTNPVTGRIWMDRNLGASQVATSSTDALAYGDLYQWGRGADGHQCRNSGTTTVVSSVEQPNHGDFIISNTSPSDWLVPQNTNLWQGVNGINNPCPSGYRLPTETEFNNERTSWSTYGASGAISSSLKLPMAGQRNNSNGFIISPGAGGHYWGSTNSSSVSNRLDFSVTSANVGYDVKAMGFSVRCLKN
jgi:uncharacterized protein (TIGR02145 family)